MCLGEICQVVGLEEGGRLRVRGTIREQVVSSLALNGSVDLGDWVVAHSGFALERLDPEEAEAALALRATVPIFQASIDSAPAVPAPAFSPSENRS